MRTEGPDGRPPSRVDDYFTDRAEYWRELYAADDVDGVIFRARQEQALRWAAGVAEPGARVLDIGCGAGLLSLGLASLGFRVDAIDSSEGMIAVAREQLATAPKELAARVAVAPGDVYRLAWPDDSFDLVVALGVVPWLDDPAGGLAEMARVVRPGGHAIVTSDNRSRLTHAIDPLWNPHLRRLRRAVGDGLRRLRMRGPRPDAVSEHLYTPGELDDLLAGAGFVAVERVTVGFGRFTVADHRLVGDDRGRALHRRLQRLADRGVPLIRTRGNHDMALAQKPTG